jgi:RHS repeat-associated protein
VQELNGTTPTANLLTGGVDERFIRTDANGTLNYLTDALGSTIALTDPSGNSQVQYSYDPYGNMNATGSTTNSYTYTGREFDGLGIYYYRARYYNPAMGRFLSEDPIGFAGGINKYAYVGNNPISYFDPFGMDKGSPGSSCNAATAFLTNVSAQLAAEGGILELTGLALSEVSIVSLVFAPEGLLVEGGGVETGASLMQLGGLVSTLGDSLRGYLEDSYTGAGLEVAVDQFVSNADSALTSQLFPGIASSQQTIVTAILNQIPGVLTKDIVTREESACDSQ